MFKDLSPPNPEYRPPQTENYFNKLFERSKFLLQSEQNGQTLAQLQSTPISRWKDFSSDDHRITYNNIPGEPVINKAIIVRSTNYDYGLVMGDLGKRGLQKSRPIFEFGLIPRLGDLDFQETLDHYLESERQRDNRSGVLNYLDLLVHDPEHSGRFLVEHHSVKIDFLDVARFNAGDHSVMWGDDEFLSDNGLAASLGLVKELIRRVQRN